MTILTISKGGVQIVPTLCFSAPLFCKKKYNINIVQYKYCYIFAKKRYGVFKVTGRWSFVGGKV